MTEGVVGRGRVVVALLALAACTSGGARSPSVNGSNPAAPASSAPAGPFVRTCQTSVYGDLGTGWRKRSLVVGSIAFVGLPSLADAPPEDFASNADGYRSNKVLVVVDLGTQVTVAIASADRQHLALLYDGSAFKQIGGYSIGDGETGVTFQACGKGESPYGVEGPTQFNGAFIVDGPRCAMLEVSEQGSVSSPVPVSFGAGRCG